MVRPRTFVLITLFPEPVLGMLQYSILRRAQEKGIVQYQVLNLRDFGNGRYRSTDDYPYGGGAGMILRPEPLFRAIRKAVELFGQENAGEERSGESAPKLVYPSPQGRLFTQKIAREWATDPRPIIFLAGHYEGVDQRVLDAHPIEEWSMGDFILTGGELPALSMVDAVVRLIPGVVSDPNSVLEETFSGDRFDFPQYTRPPVYEGYSVPEVLRSGDHRKVKAFREEKASEKMKIMRPDMIEGHNAEEGETERTREKG
jgi:tRNA (guanine37-N1)-methyltransferase